VSEDVEWEEVAGDTVSCRDDRCYVERLGVPGGWLYRSTIIDCDARLVSSIVVFVPDPSVRP